MGFYYFFYESPLITSTIPGLRVPEGTLIPTISDRECLQCHKQQANAWLKSHHAAAMQTADDQHVLADFNHAKFTRQGITTTFFTKNNKYFINSEGRDYEVKYTLGVSPLQTYLIASTNGRLQNFTIAWDVKKKHWFDLLPNEKTPPGDVLHWTGLYQNANMMCITCHTTNYHKNYSEKTNSYHSTWSEMNVGCQACHGPGGNHIAWTKNKNMNVSNKGLINNLKTSQQIIAVCATCHSRRTELIDNPDLSKPLLDNYLISDLSLENYYPDGQQRTEVYVYNSYRQSKMYQMGVSCIDCHDAHSAKLKAEGNAVCTQCHNPIGNPRFPNAAGNFDTPDHTFHSQNSSGSQCVGCHMPRKNYMIIQARPDHSIRIPRPDLTLKFGTPNACNNCHTNRTSKWAADTLKKWYPNYDAKTLSTSNIMKATHLGTDEAIIAAIKNENATLRLAATNLLHYYPLDKRIDLAIPLLHDSLRAIRIAAARVASTIPMEMLNAEQYSEFQNAKKELEHAENLSIDMPGANLNLAVIYENLGATEKAMHYYLRALSLDPDFTPARLNLARLYNSKQQNADAKRLLQDGIKRLPQQAELHYSLALILTEENQNTAAVGEFAIAARLLDGSSRVLLNYALALLKVGKNQLAQKTLMQAHQLDPNNTDIRNLLLNNGNI